MDVVIYEGKAISLNDFYQSKHWSHRQKLKKKFNAIFRNLFKEFRIGRYEKFEITIYYNSRLNPDNVIGLEKVFTDTLNKYNHIEDDTKKYYKGVSIYPCEQFKTNTYVIFIHHAN